MRKSAAKTHISVRRLRRFYGNPRQIRHFLSTAFLHDVQIFRHDERGDDIHKDSRTGQAQRRPDKTDNGGIDAKIFSDARKTATRGPREYFTATCAACGGEARVPFEPKSDRPVYCSECFAKMREQQR